MENIEQQKENNNSKKFLNKKISHPEKSAKKEKEKEKTTPKIKETEFSPCHEDKSKCASGQLFFT